MANYNSWLHTNLAVNSHNKLFATTLLQARSTDLTRCEWGITIHVNTLFWWGFHFSVYVGYCCNFFSCTIFIWFGCQGISGPVEWLRKYFLLLSFPKGILELVLFFKCLVEFANETIWALGFLFWKGFLTKNLISLVED